jgi:hypothetical protein
MKTNIQALNHIEELKAIKRDITTSHMEYEKKLLIVYYKLESMIKELSK